LYSVTTSSKYGKDRAVVAILVNPVVESRPNDLPGWEEEKRIINIRELLSDRRDM